MTTSERKNRKRLKALSTLKRSNPQAFEAERTRLLQAWVEQARLRVRNHELLPAGELIGTAKLYGLDGELEWEVIKQVAEVLGGPKVVTRSLTLSRVSTQAALVAEVRRNYGTGPVGRIHQGSDQRVGHGNDTGSIRSSA